MKRLVAQGHVVSGGARIQNQQFDSRAQSLYHCVFLHLILPQLLLEMLENGFRAVGQRGLPDTSFLN